MDSNQYSLLSGNNKSQGNGRTVLEISWGSKEVPSKTQPAERHPDNISGVSTWLAETLPRSSMPGYKPSLEHMTPRLPPVSLLPILVPTATRATQMLALGRENQQRLMAWNTCLTTGSGETANKSIRKPRYGIVLKASQPWLVNCLKEVQICFYKTSAGTKSQACS